MSAIVTESFNADGTQRAFQVESSILSESHVRVHFYYETSPTVFEDVPIPASQWDVLSGTILFDEAPTNGYVVKITISSDGEGLDDAPTDLSAIAANIDNLNLIFDNLDDINAVTAGLPNVNTVATDLNGTNTIGTTAGSIANVNAVGSDIANVNTNAANITSINTNAANIIAIQNASANAATATTKASEASASANAAATSAVNASTSASAASVSANSSQLKAWESEAEKLTSDSYATEPEDVFVKKYTSNGDGTFTVTTTNEYSSLHWAAKSEESSATNALDVSVDTTNFNGQLGGSDTDVQKALDTLDDLVVPSSVLAGQIIATASSSVPTGFLECDGSSLDTTLYADLFLAIGYTYGGSGSNFDLPDLRGEFLRGWDNGRGIDTGRALGTNQKGTIVAWGTGNTGVWSPTYTTTGTSASQPVMGADDYNTGEYGSISVFGTSNVASSGLKGGSTSGYTGISRPRNVAVMYCIKY